MRDKENIYNFIWKFSIKKDKYSESSSRYYLELKIIINYLLFLPRLSKTREFNSTI